MSVQITLEFNSLDEFDRELRGVIEVIAHADDGDLDSGDYAAVMADVGTQAVLAHEKQVLGWFLNGDRIGSTTGW